MAKKTLKKGIFITFEGIEGCGKTTQAKLLCGHLKKRGYACVLTREPGGTKLGEAVRRLLLHSSDIKISDLAELFLFEAARAQFVGEVVRKALSKKRIVISDRFSDATFAYQGYGGGVPFKTISTLDAVARQLVEPLLTILLDIDVGRGLRRARRKGVDRMERKDIAYHRRVRAGYLALARRYPRRIKTIKVQDTIAGTQALVRREAEHVIQRYKRP